MEAVVPNEPITIRVRNDIRLKVNPTRDGRWYYFADQDLAWGNAPTPWLVDKLTPGDTFLDIGGHVGYFSFVARDIVGASSEVYVFEAHPDNYQLLVENIELNDFENITAEQMAVGEGPETIRLYNADKTIRATMAEQAGVRGQAMVVEQVAMDSYFENLNTVPDVVKINAEGAEYAILDGMQELIDAAHPVIGVEIHPGLLEELGSSCEEVIEWLYEYGYTLSMMDSGERIPEADAFKLCERKTSPFGVVAEYDRSGEA